MNSDNEPYANVLSEIDSKINKLWKSKWSFGEILFGARTERVRNNERLLLRRELQSMSKKMDILMNFMESCPISPVELGLDTTPFNRSETERMMKWNPTEDPIQHAMIELLKDKCFPNYEVLQ